MVQVQQHQNLTIGARRGNQLRQQHESTEDGQDVPCGTYRAS